MTFAREKRWLLGWLALLAPLPLPFNDLLEWTVVAAYWIVVLAFLRRTTREDAEWLPNWGANVLGLLYLPFLWFDFRSLWRGQLVKPLVHLILFTLAVKLFALRRERDKWHALFGAFFLFLAAMATSVHPTILVYMIVFLVLAVLTLTRFAYFHVLAGFGHRDRDPARLPLRGFLVGAVLATLVVAIPLFLFLPRVRTPYILGRGAGTGTIIHGTGFSDEMTLDGIGSIRGDRTVALRLAYDGATPPNHERRIKVITYDRFAGTYWKRSEKQENGPPFSGGFFRLAPGTPKYWMTIWRQRLDSAGLPLPVEALSIEAPVWRLESDRGGGVFFTVPPMEVTQYRAGMGDEPLLRGLQPTGPDDPTLDSTGVTERMRVLAKTAVASGGKGSPAANVESYSTPTTATPSISRRPEPRTRSTTSCSTANRDHASTSPPPWCCCCVRGHSGAAGHRLPGRRVQPDRGLFHRAPEQRPRLGGSLDGRDPGLAAVRSHPGFWASGLGADERLLGSPTGVGLRAVSLGSLRADVWLLRSAAGDRAVASDVESAVDDARAQTGRQAARAGDCHSSRERPGNGGDAGEPVGEVSSRARQRGSHRRGARGLALAAAAPACVRARAQMRCRLRPPRTDGWLRRCAAGHPAARDPSVPGPAPRDRAGHRALFAGELRRRAGQRGGAGRTDRGARRDPAGTAEERKKSRLGRHPERRLGGKKFGQPQ